MMINKRLIETVGGCKKYIAGNVALQWCSLSANIAILFGITGLLENLYEKTVQGWMFLTWGMVLTAGLAVRYVCAVGAARMGYLSSKTVKKTLREKIYQKLLRLGTSYQEQVTTSEVVQVAVEGVDQLETYFGAYLPQLFYSMLAPITLFCVLGFANLASALVLLVCVPLIPIAIAAVQTWAKKLLAKYWGQYTSLGDSFLENLQGLTTLKIYQADKFKQEEMNREAEHFRKITMKVLTMQLNSITIMDLVAYGGAALGAILAVTQFAGGQVSLGGCLLILLLSAEFFIPMRQLGSFFHIAMNGMAASDKIFRLLDLPEEEPKRAKPVSDRCDLALKDLHFSYEAGREILHGVDLSVPEGSFTALVGESGCGKSTIASLLLGRNRNYAGSVTVGGVEVTQLDQDVLLSAVTYVGYNSHLFQGTVRDNLKMGKPDASDRQLWEALKRVKLSEFLMGQQGLDTLLQEQGGNFSGGQRQRLALARALLHDSPVYLFDEATSNIDVESENDIMELIHLLAQTKTVMLISHRLANVQKAHKIYVLKDGCVVEQGTHPELLSRKGHYAKLWEAQQALEHHQKEEKA